MSSYHGDEDYSDSSSDAGDGPEEPTSSAPSRKRKCRYTEEERRNRRRVANRESARRMRAKRSEAVQALETNVMQLTDLAKKLETENKDYAKTLERMKTEMEQLRQQLQNAKSGSGRAASIATGVTDAQQQPQQHATYPTTVVQQADADSPAVLTMGQQQQLQCGTLQYAASCNSYQAQAQQPSGVNIWHQQQALLQYMGGHQFAWPGPNDPAAAAADGQCQLPAMQGVWPLQLMQQPPDGFAERLPPAFAAAGMRPNRSVGGNLGQPPAGHAAAATASPFTSRAEAAVLEQPAAPGPAALAGPSLENNQLDAHGSVSQKQDAAATWQRQHGSPSGNLSVVPYVPSRQQALAVQAASSSGKPSTPHLQKGALLRFPSNASCSEAHPAVHVQLHQGQSAGASITGGAADGPTKAAAVAAVNSAVAGNERQQVPEGQGGAVVTELQLGTANQGVAGLVAADNQQATVPAGMLEAAGISQQPVSTAAIPNVFSRLAQHGQLASAAAVTGGLPSWLLPGTPGAAGADGGIGYQPSSPRLPAVVQQEQQHADEQPGAASAGRAQQQPQHKAQGRGQTADDWHQHKCWTPSEDLLDELFLNVHDNDSPMLLPLEAPVGRMAVQQGEPPACTAVHDSKVQAPGPPAAAAATISAGAQAVYPLATGTDRYIQQQGQSARAPAAAAVGSAAAPAANGLHATASAYAALHAAWSTGEDVLRHVSGTTSSSKSGSADRSQQQLVSQRVTGQQQLLAASQDESNQAAPQQQAPLVPLAGHAVALAGNVQLADQAPGAAGEVSGQQHMQGVVQQQQSQVQQQQQQRQPLLQVGQHPSSNALDELQQLGTAAGQPGILQTSDLSDAKQPAVPLYVGVAPGLQPSGTPTAAAALAARPLDPFEQWASRHAAATKGKDLLEQLGNILNVDVPPAPVGLYGFAVPSGSNSDNKTGSKGAAGSAGRGLPAAEAAAGDIAWQQQLDEQQTKQQHRQFAHPCQQYRLQECKQQRRRHRHGTGSPEYDAAEDSKAGKGAQGYRFPLKRPSKLMSKHALAAHAEPATAAATAQQQLRLQQGVGEPSSPPHATMLTDGVTVSTTCHGSTGHPQQQRKRRRPPSAPESLLQLSSCFSRTGTEGTAAAGGAVAGAYLQEHVHPAAHGATGRGSHSPQFQHVKLQLRQHHSDPGAVPMPLAHPDFARAKRQQQGQQRVRSPLSQQIRAMSACLPEPSEPQLSAAADGCRSFASEPWPYEDHGDYTSHDDTAVLSVAQDRGSGKQHQQCQQEAQPYVEQPQVQVQFAVPQPVVPLAKQALVAGQVQQQQQQDQQHSSKQATAPPAVAQPRLQALLISPQLQQIQLQFQQQLLRNRAFKQQQEQVGQQQQRQQTDVQKPQPSKAGVPGAAAAVRDSMPNAATGSTPTAVTTQQLGMLVVAAAAEQLADAAAPSTSRAASSGIQAGDDAMVPSMAPVSGMAAQSVRGRVQPADPASPAAQESVLLEDSSRVQHSGQHDVQVLSGQQQWQQDAQAAETVRSNAAAAAAATTAVKPDLAPLQQGTGRHVAIHTEQPSPLQQLAQYLPQHANVPATAADLLRQPGLPDNAGLSPAVAAGGGNGYNGTHSTYNGYNLPDSPPQLDALLASLHEHEQHRAQFGHWSEHLEHQPPGSHVQASAGRVEGLPSTSRMLGQPLPNLQEQQALVHPQQHGMAGEQRQRQQQQKQQTWEQTAGATAFAAQGGPAWQGRFAGMSGQWPVSVPPWFSGPGMPWVNNGQHVPSWQQQQWHMQQLQMMQAGTHMQGNAEAPAAAVSAAVPTDNQQQGSGSGAIAQWQAQQQLMQQQQQQLVMMQQSTLSSSQPTDQQRQWSAWPGQGMGPAAGLGSTWIGCDQAAAAAADWRGNAQVPAPASHGQQQQG